MRRRTVFIATRTTQGCADELRAALGGQHPEPVLPGRIVANVTGVAAFEIGYPMLLVILVESDDSAFHLFRG